jgi:dipeptidyl aminopeptidase/acylaminoacyl peptidase
LLGSLASARLAAQKESSSLGALAYVQADGLWLRDLPGGQPRRIAAGGKIASPSFSPSGQWIFFKMGGSLHVVSREGGQAARLQGGEAEWRPDRDDLVVEQPNGLSACNAATGWKQAEWSIPGAELPALFSPDNTEIAYAGHVVIRGTRVGRLCCTGVGNPHTPLRAVVSEPGSAIIPYRWMPDGELLYWRDPDFSASFLADGLELFRVPAHGPGGTPRSLGIWTLVNRDFVSLAPGGDALAVSAGRWRDVCDNKRIARIQWPSGEVRYLTGERIAAVAPACSPDGKWIAYSAAPAVPNGCGGGEAMRRSLARRRIWVVQADGNAGPIALTRDERYRDEEPQWSWDGRHILFCRIDDARVQTVWLMGSDGAGAVQVAGPLDAGNGDDPDLAWFGYYGTIDWKSRIDWHGARVPPGKPA